MKKSLQVEPNVADLINKMHGQLVELEKKIDILINKPSPAQPETRPFYQHYKRPEHSHGHGSGRQETGFRERTMHKAICADCSKECEVPFKPTGERPVYCKECFSKRKGGGGSFKEGPDTGHRQTSPIRESHSFKPRGERRKKPGLKKRPFVKRRKTRI